MLNSSAAQKYQIAICEFNISIFSSHIYKTNYIISGFAEKGQHWISAFENPIAGVATLFCNPTIDNVIFSCNGNGKQEQCNTNLALLVLDIVSSYETKELKKQKLLDLNFTFFLPLSPVPLDIEILVLLRRTYERHHFKYQICLRLILKSLPNMFQQVLLCDGKL